MQNKYVGDIGDFGKYGLLNALCDEDILGPGLSLGVVWYLVENDDRSDGKFTDYLTTTSGRHATLRACDEALHDKLKIMVEDGDRCVARVAREGVLRSATQFVDGLPPRGPAERRRWLSAALRQVEGCDLVFLDPDNGLRAETQEGVLRSQKHVYLDEVVQFYNERRTVVIYHHLGRQAGAQEQIRGWRNRLDDIGSTSLNSLACWYHRGTARVYFIVPAPAHTERIITRVKAFVAGPWGQGQDPHFTVEGT